MDQLEKERKSHNESNRRYYKRVKDNPEFKRKKRNLQKLWHEKNIDRSKYLICKVSAKQRGLYFDLSYEEFLQFKGTVCSYCGDSLDCIRLDRIDSNLGYRLDNVVSCCWTCNKMKLDLPKDFFLKHCEKIISWSR